MSQMGSLPPLKNDPLEQRATGEKHKTRSRLLLLDDCIAHKNLLSM